MIRNPAAWRAAGTEWAALLGLVESPTTATTVDRSRICLASSMTPAAPYRGRSRRTKLDGGLTDDPASATGRCESVDPARARPRAEGRSEEPRGDHIFHADGEQHDSRDDGRGSV